MWFVAHKSFTQEETVELADANVMGATELPHGADDNPVEVATPAYDTDTASSSTGSFLIP